MRADGVQWISRRVPRGAASRLFRARAPRREPWPAAGLAALALALAAAVVRATARADDVPAAGSPAEAGSGAEASAAAGEGTNAVPVTVKADRLLHEGRTGRAEAHGNVVVTRDEDSLEAGHVRFNTVERRGEAWGDVRVQWGDTLWRGDAMEYDAATGCGSFSNLWCRYPPFCIEASSATRGTNAATVFRRALISTCTNDTAHWHYHLSARDITVRDDGTFAARRIVWYFGRVPVFYLPYLEENADGDSGFIFRLGHDTRLGGYMLGSYGYPFSPRVSGRTHVDYRAKRGFGYGQETLWTTSDDRGSANLTGYYARDRAARADGAGGDEYMAPTNRYRLRLEYDHDLSERDCVLVSADFLSDPRLREDFFEHEYRASRDPDNHASFTRRGDRYTAAMLWRTRLNDFYSGVNRLPEISVDVMRQQIGTTFFEYEGHSSLAYLERVWKAAETNREDYAALRADTLHTVYLPSRLFGFLNVIPRAAYRGTWYSALPALTEPGARNAAAAGSGAAPAGTNSYARPLPGDLRSLYEIGTEVSFRAHRTWEGAGRPLRHVVEPHANYTFVPRPDIVPERLYQFDKIDGLDREHKVEFGVRNRLQAKHRKRISEIINADVFTTYNIEPEEDERRFEAVGLNLEADPAAWAAIEAKAEYDFYESALDALSTRVILSWEGWMEADIEHRLKPGESSLLKADLTVMPDRPWSVDACTRYEFEDDRLEEQAVFLRRQFDCMVLRIGGGVLPGRAQADGSRAADEWQASIEFWLTAFPKSGLRAASESL